MLFSSYNALLKYNEKHDCRLENVCEIERYLAPASLSSTNDDMESELYDFSSNNQSLLEMNSANLHAILTEKLKRIENICNVLGE